MLFYLRKKFKTRRWWFERAIAQKIMTEPLSAAAMAKGFYTQDLERLILLFADWRSRGWVVGFLPIDGNTGSELGYKWFKVTDMGRQELPKRYDF
jgi:hypothetical protein